MKVVGVLHGKGGVGKSTLAVNIARALQLRGLRVAVADGDAQSTAASWRASRSGEEELPTVAPVPAASDLQAVLRRLSDAHDVTIVDGGAHLDKMHASIIKASDLVLVPVQPSPTDIWASEEIVRLIEKRQEVTGGPEAAFVVSRRKAGTKLGESVTDVLSRFNTDVWDGTCDRVVYAEAMGQGKAVVETGDKKAAAEIEALTDNVINALRYD
jgi:chromosome partitioning protein